MFTVQFGPLSKKTHPAPNHKNNSKFEIGDPKLLEKITHIALVFLKVLSVTCPLRGLGPKFLFCIVEFLDTKIDTKSVKNYIHVNHIFTNFQYRQMGQIGTLSNLGLQF